MGVFYWTGSCLSIVALAFLFSFSRLIDSQHVSIKVVSLETKQNENHRRSLRISPLGGRIFAKNLVLLPRIIPYRCLPQLPHGDIDLSNHQNIRILLPNETRA